MPGSIVTHRSAVRTAGRPLGRARFAALLSACVVAVCLIPVAPTPAEGSSLRGAAVREVVARTQLAVPSRSNATPSAPAIEGVFPAALADRLQDALDRARESLPLPGVQGAVILADGSRWTGASGVRELNPTVREAAPDSSFVVGSITKTFVAALIVQLAEERRLSLADRLSRWFPRYPGAPAITVRQLLNHTSGVYNYFAHPKYEALVFKRPAHRWTTTEILALTGKPYFPPGRGYQYSNTNYVLLGLIAERVMGRSLGDEIRRRFIEPLEMHETFFQGEERIPVRGAMGYLRTSNERWLGLWDGSPQRPNTSAATVAWAAGAMVSSARDLATWTRALYGGDVLAPSSLSEMLDFGRYAYGLGVRALLLAGQPAWGHSGSLRGFTAATWYLPVQQLTVSVTTNRGRIDPTLVAARLAQIVFEDLDTNPPTVQPPAETVVRTSDLATGSVQVRVDWSGYDDLSGIRRFDLQQSRNGVDWLTVPLPRATAMSVTLDLDPGYFYAFRVRARDRAGNVGAWAQYPNAGASIRLAASDVVRYAGTRRDLR
jgi:D-alanyl-D-alanine carboxypeptidase